jgi:hypothetical protein
MAGRPELLRGGLRDLHDSESGSARPRFEDDWLTYFI